MVDDRKTIKRKPISIKFFAFDYKNLNGQISIPLSVYVYNFEKMRHATQNHKVLDSAVDIFHNWHRNEGVEVIESVNFPRKLRIHLEKLMEIN